MSYKVGVPLAALLLLSACDTIDPRSGSVDPAFGEAFRYDMAVQTINPDPVYAADAAQPGDNGDKGAAAVKRYRTDRVKDVVEIKTSSDSGSGGNQ